MATFMNRSEVQTPAAQRQTRGAFANPATVAALRPADAGEKKGQSANAPVGSIAAIESQLGF